MASLVAAVVGALISLIAVTLGARLQGRREHQNWLRDQKLRAAVDYVTATRHLLNQYRLIGSQAMDQRDRREWRDRMQAGRSALYLWCAPESVALADDLARRLHTTTPATPTEQNSETEGVFRALIQELRTEISYRPVQSGRRRPS